MTQICGEYDIECPMGKGTLGKVFKCSRNGELYVLKQVTKGQFTDDTMKARGFLNMLKAMKAIESRRVLPLKRECEDEFGRYSVVQFLKHPNLTKYLADHAQIQLRDCTLIMSEILRALQDIHSMGKTLHLNLKPNNIFIVEQGSQPSVILADYNMFQLDDTQTNLITVEHLAPELLTEGAATVKAEAWAVGVVFFYLLTGEYPFTKQDVQKQRIGNYCNPFSWKERTSKKKKRQLSADEEKKVEDLFERIFEFDYQDRIGLHNLKLHTLFAQHFTAQEMKQSETFYSSFSMMDNNAFMKNSSKLSYLVSGFVKEEELPELKAPPKKEFNEAQYKAPPYKEKYQQPAKTPEVPFKQAQKPKQQMKQSQKKGPERKLLEKQPEIIQKKESSKKQVQQVIQPPQFAFKKKAEPIVKDQQPAENTKHFKAKQEAQIQILQKRAPKNQKNPEKQIKKLTQIDRPKQIARQNFVNQFQKQKAFYFFEADRNYFLLQASDCVRRSEKYFPEYIKFAFCYVVTKLFIIYSRKLVSDFKSKKIPANSPPELRLNQFLQSKVFENSLRRIQEQLIDSADSLVDLYNRCQQNKTKLFSKIPEFSQILTKDIPENDFSGVFKEGYRKTTSLSYGALNKALAKQQKISAAKGPEAQQQLKKQIHNLMIKVFICHSINRMFDESLIPVLYEDYFKWKKNNRPKISPNNFDFVTFKSWLEEESAQVLIKVTKIIISKIFNPQAPV